MKFPLAILITILAVLLGVHALGRAWAADVPLAYLGRVVSVADGDTLTVSIDGWPAPYNPVEVRVAGIDTPESRKQDAGCVKELRLGLIAKKRARDLLPVGASVLVTWTGEREKYGRLLAHVALPDGRDFAKQQVLDGMAKPYRGGRKLSWCK